jgi:hypothetical protein
VYADNRFLARAAMHMRRMLNALLLGRSQSFLAGWSPPKSIVERLLFGGTARSEGRNVAIPEVAHVMWQSTDALKHERNVPIRSLTEDSSHFAISIVALRDPAQFRIPLSEAKSTRPDETVCFRSIPVVTVRDFFSWVTCYADTNGRFNERQVWARNRRRS